jgi:hypothetical protein
MIPAPLLAALLSFAPLAAASEPSEPPAPAVTSDAKYNQALDNVRNAQKLANEEPERGSTQLRDALNVLQGFGPRLATDPEGQDLRLMAQLTLARSLLATNQAESARAVMDEAIRTARGDPLPTKNFGPGLAALHRERAGVLAKHGTGSIEVDCRSPCRVFINERPTQARTDGLVPGNYRVWIEATDGSAPDVQLKAEVEHEGQVVHFDFGRAPVLDDDPPVAGPSKPRGRVLPRWADILLVSAGAAAIGTGAALWAIDGSCPGGADPEDVVACPRVYITRTAGIVTVAAGSALLLGGTIVLTVDEVRAGRQRGTQASLVWTFRF